MKTACLVGKAMNYEVAAAYLKAHGMKFYSISTDDEYTELQKYAISIYGAGRGIGLWIDATFDKGKWITSSGLPLHSSAIPTKYFDEGISAIISNFYGKFELIATSCLSTQASFAEFYDTSKAAKSQ